MIVNNFNILARHFDTLKCSEDFFFVQILQRTKDGHEKAHVIRSYYFYNVFISNVLRIFDTY